MLVTNSSCTHVGERERALRFIPLFPPSSLFSFSFSLQIMNEIQDNGIKIYTGETDDDDDDNPDIKELKASLYTTHTYISIQCVCVCVCVCGVDHHLSLHYRR